MDQRLIRVKIEGYRSLKSVELTDIGPRTVLIGPNGAGKSNLLSFFRLVAHAMSGSLGRFVGERGGASVLLHRGAAVTPELAFELDFERADGVRNAYHARLAFAAGERLVFVDERVGKATAGDAYAWRTLGAGHFESALPEATGAAETATRTGLQRIGFYHFHDTSRTSALRANARAVDAKYLRSDGSNLAARLRQLSASESPADAAAFRRIVDWVRQIAPFIKSIEPDDVNGGMVRLHWIDTRDELFGPEHLSDGTLRAIALFTALGQPLRSVPMVSTIDEPELGLHPAALALFCGLVHSVSTARQVIVATQSPALLDHFEAGDVCVVEQRDGASVLRRLDPVALAGWLEDYTLSQLFDGNVLGGRP